MSKKRSSFHEAHTSKAKSAFGGEYGSGVKAPVGRQKLDYIGALKSKSVLGKPPKKLA